MKRIIVKRLILIIFAAMLLSLALNYLFQLKSSYDDARETSKVLFWQIEQILSQNEAESEQTRQDFENECLIRAKAAAYIVQYHPEMLQDQTEMKKVAELLQVDEFHIFDTEGNLYAGSEPKYFGLNFNSGEQMQFFLPMLEDRSLELCQDITPNTAEQKLMQYAAVWREDGKEIVQIGMEPERVLNAMKKNELSYIFSLLTAKQGATMFALDAETYEVLGSTNSALVGKNAGDVGFDPSQMRQEEGGYRAVINGIKSYCVYEQSGSVLLARTCTESSLIEPVNNNSVWLALYLLLLSIIMVLAITYYLNRHILKSISSINDKLLMITQGDLDTKLAERSTPEFAELSDHINEMVRSLLETTDKLSTVLDAARVSIGIYEYTPGMKRIMATSRLREVLGLDAKEAEHLLSDYKLFERKLKEVRSHPANPEKTVFRIPGEPDRFVSMETFAYEKSRMGIVIDITQSIQERQSIEWERDTDLLTGLYNRRAFYNRLDNIPPESWDHAALIMVDADDLKLVNDIYRHENGDRYLQAIAGVLRSGGIKNRVAARLGGDEFVLFLYGFSTTEELMAQMNTLLEQRNGRMVELTDHTVIPVRFSVGYALYPGDGNDSHALMKIADDRMYQEKKRRKNMAFKPEV
ncbi:MAG: diguanylate cyclase [Oscillospiraceae bacterium]